MLRYYHYRMLTSRGQQVYKELVDAIRCFKPSVVVSANVEGSLEIILDAIRFDNPHLFYVDWSVMKYRIAPFRGESEIFFSYRMGREEVQRCLRQASLLAKKLRRENEEQTVRAVHDYIALHTKYDHESANEVKIRPKSFNMLGPIFDGLGVCAGIAAATHFLLKELNVECTTVKGRVITPTDSRGELHAWNLVMLHGKTLRLDVTWDLAVNGRVSYTYFCIPAA